MSKKPLEMSMIRKVLQLYQNNRSIHEITRMLGISRNSVRKYIRLYGQTGDADSLQDGEMAAVVHPAEPPIANSERHVELLAHFKEESAHLLKRRGNRQVIWEEYREKDPNGYSYSQYCLLWKQYIRTTDISLVHEYGPGEVIEIDFAGKKLPYVDQQTGEVVDCSVFIGVMPFSGMFYCRAVHSQQMADVALCIGRMLAFFGGTPTGYVICDNMATLVRKSSSQEPQLTDACEQMAVHYGTFFSPTRPYSPKDKPHAERSVDIAYNRIYTPLRNQAFYSLEELNRAISGQARKLNERPFRKSPLSRRLLFEGHEKALLRALPATLFCPREMQKGTAGKNNHVSVTDPVSGVMFHYSVPWQYIGQTVKIYFDDHSVEVYLDNLTRERIAVHRREGTRLYTTIADHVPPDHQAVLKSRGWDNNYFYQLADRVGPCTRMVIERIIARQPNRTQAYRTCMGLLKLNISDGYAGRLEAACNRIQQVPQPSLQMVKNILARGLDKAPADLFTRPQEEPLQPAHENIRGKETYQ